MSNDDKKGKGFIHRLLYQDPEEGNNQTSSQGVGATIPTSSTVQQPVAANLPPVNLSGDAASFVTKFRDAIRNSNEIGQSFIQVLYKLSTNPDDSHYRQAFELIRIMNPTLTANDIKSSLEKLIAFVRTETDSYTKQGNDKKAQLESQQQSEKSALQSTIASMQVDINALRQNLQTKESELAKKQTELMAVDGKYQPQINEVQTTLSAIKAASDETCSSLNQFLTGVTNYLK